MTTQPTPEQQAEMAKLAAQQLADYAQAQQLHQKMVIALSDITVQLDGPEAATRALFLLQSFARQYGPHRARLPPDVGQLIDAAEAAVTAANAVMSRRVIVPSGIVSPSGTPLSSG